MFDNAQGRKPRGRGYGDCWGQRVVEVVVCGVFELDAGVIDAWVSHFRSWSVALEGSARVDGTVETIGNRQYRSVWSVLLSEVAGVMVVISFAG